MKLLTIQISLVGTHKKINRKVQITDDYNLNAVHIAIQELFYFNYNLEHEFEYNDVVYLPAIENDFTKLYNLQQTLREEIDILVEKDIDVMHLYNTNKKFEDDCTTKLEELNLKVGDCIEYTYDHDNTYELILELLQTNPANSSKIKLVDYKGKFVPQGLDIDTYNKLKTVKSGIDYEQLSELEHTFDIKLAKQNIESLLPTTTMYE